MHTQLLPSLPPSFCLFSLSFSVCFGCWGFYQGFTHTMHTTTHTTTELQHFIATGLKEARLAPQGALLTLETPCLPWLSSKDNAQLSLAPNQEAGEMEREPGDHSVLLGNSILFPSQRSTHMSIGELVALRHEDSLRNHGKADTSTLTPGLLLSLQLTKNSVIALSSMRTGWFQSSELQVQSHNQVSGRKPFIHKKAKGPSPRHCFTAGM